MSAFIISEETMHRVVHAFDKHDHEAHASRRCLPAMGLLDADGCHALDALGNRLYRLNAAAMAARYNDPDEAPTDYRYRPLGQVPLVHMYKALGCLIYQCSEGDVPDHPDYKMLTCLRAKLAQQIVEASPEYDRAPYDTGWPEPPRTNPAAPRMDDIKADVAAGRPVKLTDIIKAQQAAKTTPRAVIRAPAGKPAPQVNPTYTARANRPDYPGRFNKPDLAAQFRPGPAMPEDDEAPF